jgi:phenylacetate-CoA ligase
MPGLSDKIYARLPAWAQHVGVSSYGFYWRWLRFGPGYSGQLAAYLAREHYTSQQWQSWSRQELAELLKLAITQVPYYANTWDERQKQAALAGNLTDLPLLEKDAIRAQPRAFVRQDFHPGRDYTFYTSGTSGTPIASIWTRPEFQASMAVREARSARWAGVSFSCPRATFSGRMVEPEPLSRGPYYRFNLAENQVYLSAFHLRPDTARQYVQSLEKHKVEWLTGYAMSYYLLGKMILEQNIPVPHLKAIITTSEKVTLEMRQVMETAYRCRVFEEYSTVENTLFASQCEVGRLHVSPDIGLVEILRPDGIACAPGEIGEIVATCLFKKYQIFIRYRLGDFAAWDPDPCPCGRALPVIKEVVGRIEDVVVGPDGRQMVRFHGVFVNQPHVCEGQIIQEELDHIHVKIVPASGFGADDIQDIIGRVQQRLGSGVNVTIEEVGSIPRTKAGKFQAVISHLKQRG